MGNRTGDGIVIFERFEVLETVHPTLNMPLLRPSAIAGSAEPALIAVAPTVCASLISICTWSYFLQSVQLLFNVQHDCASSGCDTSGRSFQLQERQESEKTTSLISHRNRPWYIINTHSFHNAMKLRKLLPSHLTEPKHLYPNRNQRHQEIAKALVVTRAEKKAETARKAAETRAKKAAKKAGQAGAGQADNEGAEAVTEDLLPIPPIPPIPPRVPETLLPILQQGTEGTEHEPLPVNVSANTIKTRSRMRDN
jgi:hypothetical protein